MCLMSYHGQYLPDFMTLMWSFLFTFYSMLVCSNLYNCCTKPYGWNIESILSGVHQAHHMIANKLQTIINQIWTMKEQNCLFEKVQAFLSGYSFWGMSNSKCSKVKNYRLYQIKNKWGNTIKVNLLLCIIYHFYLVFNCL